MPTTNNIAFIPLLWLVGLAIGKGGEIIKRVMQKTGTNIRYDKDRKGFVITGKQDQVRLATNEMTTLINQIKQRGDYMQKATEATEAIKDDKERQVAWKLFCKKLDDDGFPLHSPAELKKLKPKFDADWEKKKLKNELEMGFYAKHRTDPRRPRAAAAAGGSAAGGSATGGSAAPTGLWCRAVAGGSAAGGSTAAAEAATAAGGSAAATETATEATPALLERVAKAEAKAALAEAKAALAEAKAALAEAKAAEAKAAAAEAKVAEDEFKAFLVAPRPDCWDDE
jgi:hypothetical protein